jgi:single-strand DNA-binding protein
MQQTFIGRLTTDAAVRNLKDGRKVVHFTIAMNRRFKSKDSTEVKERTTFLNCSYWLNTSIAAHLKKGNLIAAAGYTGVNAWINSDGDAKAGLTLHVQAIDFLAKVRASNTNVTTTAETADDLPF